MTTIPAKKPNVNFFILGHHSTEWSRLPVSIRLCHVYKTRRLAEGSGEMVGRLGTAPSSHALKGRPSLFKVYDP